MAHAQYIPRRNGRACISPLARPRGSYRPLVLQHLIRAADHPPYSCIAVLAPLFATTAPISLYSPPPSRRPSANITHVDTAFFTAVVADRRIYICVLYIYHHHHSSRARVIRPAQGCHSTCSSLLSNELPYIYKLPCFPMSPYASLPPSHHLHVPPQPPTFAFAVPTYHIPLFDYTIYV